MGALLEAIARRGLLVSDGAWGTMLQAAGLEPGQCPELWNLQRPEAVRAVAAAYAAAGADLVLTNTFGGSEPLLARHGLEGRLEELNGVHRLKPPKTRAGRRTIGISEAAVVALQDHRARMLKEGLAGSDIVFCDSRGGFLRGSNMYRNHWQPIRKAAGLPDDVWRNLHIHDIRHTHASGLFSAGVDLLQISERLGHRDTSTTLAVYTHMIPGRESTAPAAFDGFLKREA